MTILVTGGTGKVGSEVVHQIIAKGVEPRVLVRDPAKASLPAGAHAVAGDLADVASMRAALDGVDTLFLLNAVVPDEFSQALTALNLARDTGIERFVYLSVLRADLMPEVPHIASKAAVERAIGALSLPATVLHATYFMQNDLALKESLMRGGVYPMPLGGKGVAVVDVRDLGEVAALELIRRDRSADLLPAESVTACGPDSLTGDDLAAAWADALGRPVAYGGDDLDAFEGNMVRYGVPGWMAYDLRLMFRATQAYGQVDDGAAERLRDLLGRPLRTYVDFTREAAASW